MNPIYTITCIEDLATSGFSHTFGFQHSLDDAHDAIDKWGHEIEECRYSYIIVEEHYPSLHSNSINSWWYKWDDEQNKFVRCETPKKFLDPAIINFAMG